MYFFKLLQLIQSRHQLLTYFAHYLNNVTFLHCYRTRLQLQKIHKFYIIFLYFLLRNRPKLVHKFTKTLQLLGDFVPQTPYRGFAPGPHWGTSVPQTPYLLPPPQPQHPGDATAWSHTLPPQQGQLTLLAVAAPGIFSWGGV